MRTNEDNLSGSLGKPNKMVSTGMVMETAHLEIFCTRNSAWEKIFDQTLEDRHVLTPQNHQRFIHKWRISIE